MPLSRRLPAYGQWSTCFRHKADLVLAIILASKCNRIIEASEIQASLHTTLHVEYRLPVNIQGRCDGDATNSISFTHPLTEKIARIDHAFVDDSRLLCLDK